MLYKQSVLDAIIGCDTMGPDYQDHELSFEGLSVRRKAQQIFKRVSELPEEGSFDIAEVMPTIYTNR